MTTMSSLALPANPDLDHLKKQAKQLLRDVRAQQGEALQTILAFHPRPTEFSGSARRPTGAGAPLWIHRLGAIAQSGRTAAVARRYAAGTGGALHPVRLPALQRRRSGLAVSACVRVAARVAANCPRRLLRRAGGGRSCGRAWVPASGPDACQAQRRTARLAAPDVRDLQPRRAEQARGGGSRQTAARVRGFA